MNKVTTETKTREQIQEEIILQQSKIIKDLLLKCEELGGDRGLYEQLINRRPVRVMLFGYKVLQKLHLTKLFKYFYSFFLCIKRA